MLRLASGAALLVGLSRSLARFEMNLRIADCSRLTTAYRGSVDE